MPGGNAAPFAGPYAQDLTACFADAIGARGLDRPAFAEALEKTGPALAAIRAAHEDGSLPLLRLPGTRGDLPALARTAGRYRARFDRVVVLGTGGSSLGGKTLCALADHGFGPRSGAPRIDFAENVDPDGLDALFAALDLACTGWLAISKSGETAETLAQLLVVLAALAARGIDAADRVTALAEPGDNTLRRLAAAHGFPVLDCDPGIGGQVLGAVGDRAAAGDDRRAGCGRVPGGCRRRARPGARRRGAAGRFRPPRVRRSRSRFCAEAASPRPC